jgi:hypothetical protein
MRKSPEPGPFQLLYERITRNLRCYFHTPAELPGPSR